MNTVNASTKLSPFQLWMGQSPRLVPHTLPRLTTSPTDNDVDASRVSQRVHDRINVDVREARDNLMLAKVFQANQDNR